jgi:hypothetical protein
MQLEEFALKIGLSKEILILLLIQAAITAVAITLGIGIGEQYGKIPL